MSCAAAGHMAAQAQRNTATTLFFIGLAILMQKSAPRRRQEQVSLSPSINRTLQPGPLLRPANPTDFMPAAAAARIPSIESSMTMQSAGGTPSEREASR